MKILTLAACVFFTSLLWSSGMALAGEGQDSGRPSLQDRLNELNEEFSREFLEKMSKLMDRELERLREWQDRDLQELTQKRESLEKIIRDKPENAQAHFELGEVYDGLGEGANAIIHTRIAERLFVQQKDIKRTAESRRNLRRFFRQYKFQPEDFLLSNL